MTIPDSSPNATAAPPMSKPSLISGPRAAAAHGSEVTPPMRMLDALQSVPSTRQSPAPNRVRAWLLALALTLLAVAALSWWQQRNEAETTLGVDVTSGSTTAAEVIVQTSTSLVIAPLSGAIPSSGPASIERAPELDPLSVLTRGQTPAPAPSAPLANSSPRTTVAVGPQLRQVAATALSVKDVPSGNSPSSLPLRRAELSTSRDPDVTLLGAMLARLSGDNPGEAVAQPATIAQLVEGCEARSSNDENEIRACKRQICAGYWGRADACPMSLRKN